MIVKNEQDWVQGAVQSVRSIVDEVIIVDTGSTDSTLDRIRALGIEPLKFQWTDSFAEARNASLQTASQPWVLVLDADERIAACDLPQIVRATQSAADGFHLIQRNYVFSNQVHGWTRNAGDYKEGNSYQGYVDNPLIRLFRNLPDMRFHGAVHEIIDPRRLPGDYKFGAIPEVIHHYGKVLQQERVASKQHFYLALGLKKIEEDPSNAKAHFDLGIQYQELGRYAEALICFDRAFEMTKMPLALFYCAISEKRLRNFDSAASLLKRALKLGLDTLDVHLELGNVHLAQDQLQQACDEYSKCLKINPKSPIAAFNQGLVLRKMGDVRGAEDFYRRALQMDPGFRRAAIEFAMLCSDQQRYPEAIELLKPVVDRNPELHEVRLALAKTYIQADIPDEALKLLATLSNLDAIALCLLGTAHLQKENLDEAQTHLEAALRRDRSLKDARINLAQIYSRKGDQARAQRYMQSVTLTK